MNIGVWRALEMVPDTLLVIFITGLDLATAIRVHGDADVHRPATYLAVLNILLFRHRSVHQNRDHLSTVRAANDVFLQ